MGRGENHGRDRSGATSAWCGLCGVPEEVRDCSREGSGTPPGPFRGAFGGENLLSEQKDSSTLSTNAVIERTFFRGRRMWPLARKSAFGAFWQLMWHGWPVSMVSVELIWYSPAHNSSPGQTHEC